MSRLNHVEKGAGLPVLVIHGGKLDHRHMLDAVEPAFDGIADRYHRVYIDLPGCGRSTGFEDIGSQVDVLDQVLAFMREKDPDRLWAVIGESRGSYIAQGLAFCAPEIVRGLCLIVPGGFPSDPAPVTPPAHAIISRPDLVAALEPGLRERAERLVVQNAELFDRIRRFKLPAAELHDPDLEARVQARFLFPFHDEMLATTFAKPSLILSGRQDSISGYADTITMLECYPRATFALLDTAGHSLSWERPELFAALLHDWLGRLEQPPP